MSTNRLEVSWSTTRAWKVERALENQRESIYSTYTGNECVCVQHHSVRVGIEHSSTRNAGGQLRFGADGTCVWQLSITAYTKQCERALFSFCSEL